MANPAYYQSRLVTPEKQQREHVFNLYMDHRAQEAPNSNQRIIVIEPSVPHYFGCTVVTDWVIRDGLGPEATIVGRAQGLQIGADMRSISWFICHNLVFTHGRFKGSTLSVLGNLQSEALSHWSIVGGSGEFTFAQGVVTNRLIPESTGGGVYTRSLHIRALCPIFPNPILATKFGPSGGNGGTVFDIPSPPRRLESVTIRAGDVIDSIAFSYIDQDGQNMTAGPWGGNGGLPHTVTLAPRETIRKVYGTTGNFGGATVITSLTFATNLRIYGPFGRASGTHFSIPESDDNNSVLAFFVRAGSLVDAIGVYVEN